MATDAIELTTMLRDAGAFNEGKLTWLTLNQPTNPNAKPYVYGKLLGVYETSGEAYIAIADFRDSMSDARDGDTYIVRWSHVLAVTVRSAESEPAE